MTTQIITMSFFDVPLDPSVEHIRPFIDMKGLRSSYPLYGKLKGQVEYMKHIAYQAELETRKLNLPDIQKLNKAIKKARNGIYTFMSTYVKDNKVYYKFHMNSDVRLLENDTNMLIENDYVMTHTHCILSDIDLAKKIIVKVFDKLRCHFKNLDVRIVLSKQSNTIHQIIILHKKD